MKQFFKKWRFSGSFPMKFPPSINESRSKAVKDLNPSYKYLKLSGF